MFPYYNQLERHFLKDMGKSTELKIRHSDPNSMSRLSSSTPYLKMWLQEIDCQN